MRYEERLAWLLQGFTMKFGCVKVVSEKGRMAGGLGINTW